MSLQAIADCMKGGLGPDAPAESQAQLLESCVTAAGAMHVQYFMDSGLNTQQAALVVRGSVLERIVSIREVHRVATARGFILPPDPFLVLERLNARRALFSPIDVPDPQALLQAASQLSRIAVGYADGSITLERRPAYQLSSYEVSVDGLSPQSGDALVDILGYQPDGDFIKRKRALDSLARIDFTKRKPYLLFTADFDGGALVAWSRMPDASGYKIIRRDVFSMVDLPPVYLQNESLEASKRSLLEDDRVFQVLSFYDWLDPDDVFLYVDHSVKPDTLYSYVISGLQRKAPGTPFIFDVPTTDLFMGQPLVDHVNELIRTEAERFGRDPTTISPYPALAEAIYGDAGLGWILAGCNLLASVRRGDAVEQTRRLSFVGSTVSTIIALGRAGRLVVPEDISTVVGAVEGSVSSYGVSQTIITVLDGVGLTEFIGGRDRVTGSGTAALERAGSSLSRILGVIDPETATLDPKLIPPALAADQISIGGRFSVQIPVASAYTGVPVEQALQGDALDLTTHAGISRLVQIIRTLYDFYPGTL